MSNYEFVTIPDLRKSNECSDTENEEQEQPTDQAILKSIQKSCERQELLLNKALEELASQRIQMNELALKVTALQQAHMEEATPAIISTDQPKLDKETAETTSATIETNKNVKQMTKNVGIEQKKFVWVRYTMVVQREGKSVSYPLLLCLGQCKQIGPNSRILLNLVGYDFVTTETTVWLVLKPSLSIYEVLKQTYGLMLKPLKSYDLADQGINYWQLIGDKQLFYQEHYVTYNSFISSGHVSLDQEFGGPSTPDFPVDSNSGTVNKTVGVNEELIEIIRSLDTSP